MKYERLNGVSLDLDKIHALDYDEETYIVTITKLILYCFKSKSIIQGVIKEDYVRLYRKWDNHKKMVVIDISTCKDSKKSTK